MSVPAQPTTEEFREKALACLDRLPPFSPILNRLLATIASEDVSFAEVAALIENDTVLAGNLLKIVNSALYGFQGTVNSVRHGVAILGVNKLRNVALSLSISRMWSHSKTPVGWSAANFNQHSMATALLSDLIAQRSKVPYPEGAFVAGLLHDVGKLLMAVALPAEFTAVQQRRTDTGEAEIECERAVMGLTHADLSGLALERWNLPAPIVRAAGCHHSPDDADEGRLHLSHIVEPANRLANELGYSSTEYRDEIQPPETALENLNLGDCTTRILDEFQIDFEVMRAFF